MSSASSMPSLQTASSMSEAPETKSYIAGSRQNNNRASTPMIVRGRDMKDVAHTAVDEAFGRNDVDDEPRSAGISKLIGTGTPEVKDLPQSITSMGFGPGLPSQGHRPPSKPSGKTWSVDAAAAEAPSMVNSWLQSLNVSRSATSMRLCLDGDLDTTCDEAILKGRASDL